MKSKTKVGIPLEKIILYESNFKRREFFERKLKEESLEVELCYSLEKLNHEIKKSKTSKDSYNLFVIVNNSEPHLDKVNQGNVIVCRVMPGKDLQGGFLIIKSELSRLSHSLSKKGKNNSYDILCIGSSTGGIPVVNKLLAKRKMNKTIVIVCQHIDSNMASSFIESLQN